MLLSMTVSASFSRSLVPCAIIEVNEQSYASESLFTSMQASRFDSVVVSEGLKRAQSLVGSKQDELIQLVTVEFNNNHILVLPIRQETSINLLLIPLIMSLIMPTVLCNIAKSLNLSLQFFSDYG